MTIEPFYSPTHLPILNSWLNARECPPATDLPVLGLVVSVDYENVAMGFLRFCEGGYALFDGLCTNPAMPPDTRSHALDLLVSSLIGKSKQLQLKGIMAWSKDKNTLERAAKHGFVESIDKFISLALTSKE